MKVANLYLFVILSINQLSLQKLVQYEHAYNLGEVGIECNIKRLHEIRNLMFEYLI